MFQSEGSEELMSKWYVLLAFIDEFVRASVCSNNKAHPIAVLFTCHTSSLGEFLRSIGPDNDLKHPYKYKNRNRHSG